VICTAVEQCGRNFAVQSRRFGISKPAHYFRSKFLREDYLYSYILYILFCVVCCLKRNMKDSSSRCIARRVVVQFG